ncbi:MAG: two-component regulator propeller domain-containing protein [Bacteroidota bacterium]
MKTIIVSFFLFFSLGTFSQIAFETQPKVEFDYFTKFDSYSTKHGLSSNYVKAIVQDSIGFMWFGTSDGLNRFDGYEFKVYKNVPDDTNSLSNNTITSLAIDIYDNLWVGTLDGLNKFDKNTNKFTRYMYSDSSQNTIAHNWVRALYADIRGYLYIETADGTFHKYDIRKDKFKYFKHGGNTDDFFQTYQMHQIYEDKNGLIWAGGVNCLGMITFDTEKEILKEHIFEKDGCPSSFLEDRYGNFYLGNNGTYGNLLYKDSLKLKRIPLNSCYCIIEDNLGNIWFGGYAYGAMRYNLRDNKITFFEHNSENNKSIISDQIIKIYQDKSGVIWFATKNGISKLSSNKYKFKHYFHIANCDNTISSNEVFCANQYNDSILWIGTWESGLDKINMHTGKIKHYKCKPTDKFTIGSDKISGFTIDKSDSNSLWISTWNGFYGGALNKLDINKEIFTRYEMGDKWIHGVLNDKNSDIWTLGWGYGTGLTKFDKNKGKPTNIHFDKNTIPFSGVEKLQIDKQNRLWYRNGYLDLNKNLFYRVLVFNVDDKENAYYLDRMKSAPNSIILNNSGHQSSECASIIIDNEKVWMCLKNGVILKFISQNIYEFFSINESIVSACLEKHTNKLWIATDQSLLSYNPITKKKTEILKLENINVIFEDKNGQIWIGSDSVLCIYNQELKKIQVVKNNIHCITFTEDKNKNLIVGAKSGLYRVDIISKEIAKVSNNIIENKIDRHSLNCIYTDSLNNFWLGTNKGLYYFNALNGSVTEYLNIRYQKNSIISNKVLSIVADLSGNLWISTDKGLSKFNIAQQSFSNFDHVNNNSLSAGNTTCALEDKNGIIWVGTSWTGLNKVNTKTLEVENYYSLTYDSTSISDNHILCIFQDSKANIWIGTENGLDRYDSINNNFIHYSTANGLPSNVISGILEDDNGNLWISTDKGLVKFNPKNNIVTNYTLLDGLQDNEFTNAYCKLNNGWLLFGGINGFNVFHPDSILLNMYKPSVFVTRIQINDSLIDNIFSLKELNLPYSQNNILFEFSAFDFNFPEQTKYQYKLVGFDKDWITTDATMRIAKYTNLPEGNYTFRVKVANNDGLWNEKEYVLSITIAPPWWRTWWFRVSCIIAIIIILVSLYRWRTATLRHRQKQLVLEVRKATAEIREKNEELSQQNEEIKTQRDMILEQNEELLQQKEEIETQRDEIESQRDNLQDQKEQIEDLYDIAIERKNLVEIKNKEIEDSIRYAKRIQTAVLPSEKYADSILGEHFIIFKPHSVVSGDFYWVTKTEEWTIVTIADCTGHGVPGAFMSMLGISFLNEIVRKKEVTNTADVLNHLRSYVIDALSQTSKEGTQKDGMDMSIVAIHKNRKRALWSGANNPLWIIRNTYSNDNDKIDLVEELKPDKMPVAIHINMEPFTNHEIDIEKDDRLYLFSDGFPDQFGGATGKKFKYKPFKKLLAETSNLTMQEQGEKIEMVLDKWMNNNGTKYEQIDDITIVGLKI